MSEKYRLLIENLPAALAEFQIINDHEGSPPDFVFLAVNSAFTQMTGLSPAIVVGKKISAVFPVVKNPKFAFCDTLARVELTGEAARFEYYEQFLGRRLDIVAYRSEPGHLTVLCSGFGEKDLRRAEGARREIAGVNRRMLEILDAGDAFVYIVDLQTHEILFTNSYGEKHFGCIVGKKCWQMLDNGKPGPCKSCLTRLVDSAGRPTGVYRDKYKNTRNGRWYDRRELALPWIDGCMVKLGIATDLTEYRQLQEQFSKVQEQLNVQLESLLDSAATWVNIVDEEGNVTYWNKAAELISGYRFEEVIGHARIWEWLYPDQELKKQNKKTWRDVIFGGKKTEHHETQITCKGGQKRILLYHAHSLVGDERAVGTIVLAAEITARKQAEKELRLSEKRYRSLVDNANEAIIVVQDNLLKFANPAARQIFGCSPDQFSGIDFFVFLHPADRENISRMHRKLMKNESIQNPHSARIIAADGSQRELFNSCVLIDWAGRPAILCLMTDVTEMKKTQEEIMKTDKLESLGLLAGGVAHDFNNYLATLLGNISLAKLYKDDFHQVHQKLENMERSIQQARNLADQLFTFARGGGSVKEVVPLRDLILENIKFTLSGTNVRCIFLPSENLQAVAVDTGQFSQVLNNIVINAVQAMPDGGIIEVAAENVMVEHESNKGFSLPLRRGPYVKISIKDQGPGIREKDLLKVFDPFFTTKERGSGLGLATSYSIIKKHGGHLSVASELGAGTTFCIFLPASVGGSAVVVREKEVVYGAGKILLMDDEEDILNITGEMLSAFGYDVILARNGQEVLDIYLKARKKGRPFDLVIMDLTVPGGMGAKETIRELLKKDPAVKAIVCSGYSSDPIMDNYHRYGFMGAIRKPFSCEELSRLVSARINDYRLTDTPEYGPGR